MINIYIKPSNFNSGNSFGLFMLDNDKVNLAKFSESTRGPLYGNMMGWKTATERYVVEQTGEELINTSIPVYSIGIDENNCSIQFIKPENNAAEIYPMFKENIAKELIEESEDVLYSRFEETAKKRRRAL